MAVVIDCFSRRVVGWAMADHIRTELVVDALQMAIWNRRPQPGNDSPLRPRVVLHQLGLRATPPRSRTARLDGQHRRLLRQFRRRKFLRHPANRATRPADLVHPRRARQRRFAFIEGFYNPRRRHSTLGYLSPADYENAYWAGHLNETAA